MPGLSQANFDKLTGMLDDPEKAARLSPEVRRQAEAAVNAYRAESSSLIKQLDPNQPTIPQALATQPATTHPKGDQAASDEWIRGEMDNPAGKVIVYDIPLEAAKQKLMEQPETFSALGFTRIPPTPETIQAMDHDSQIYQAYNDHVWRETANAATKAGKTAYRYSKAPWLQSGNGAGILDTLSTKLKHSVLPTLSQATAYVMGVDNTALFGAVGGVAGSGVLDESPEDKAKLDEDFDKVRAFFGDTSPRQKAEPPKPAIEGAMPLGNQKDEVVGGVHATVAAKGGSTKDLLDETKSDNPNTYTAGQVVGAVPEAPAAIARGASKVVGLASPAAGATLGKLATGIKSLTPWSASNEAFDAATGVVRNQLAKRGLDAGIAPVATSVIAGSAAAGATNLVQEGVDAASNYARTGETGTTAGEVAGRTLDAAKMGGLLGGGGSVVQQGAKAVGNFVRGSRRYQKLPGKLEAGGVEFEFGKGAVAPKAVKDAADEADRLGESTEAVLAEKVAPKIEQGAKDLRADETTRQKIEGDQYRATPEGQQKLPGRNLIDKTIEKLRGDMDARAKGTPADKGGVPDPVGYKGKGREVREIFNQEIDGVSLNPVEGAIELSAEEAQAFLDSNNRLQLRRTLRGPKRGAGKPGEPARGGGPALEPPEQVTPGAGRAGAKGASSGLTPPESLSTVPGRRQPSPAPEATKRFGAREALGVKSREPKKPAVRVSGPGRKPAKPARGGSLSEELRAQKYDRVWVIPRQHDVEHSETLLKSIDGYRKANPHNRDLIELDEAARIDRDARVRNGQPGGYSAMKRDQHERLKKVDEVERRAAPQGSAFEPVMAFSNSPRTGLKRTRALRAAADRAGPEARRDLEQTRVPRNIEKLEERLGAGAKPERASSLTGALVRLGDRAIVNYAYPVLKQLEGPLGPLGSGKAARAASPLNSGRRAEAADKGKAERSAKYGSWRKDEIARKKKSRKTRRKSKP